MSDVSFLSLADVTTLVRTIGVTNTVLIEGPPGVGKSSILKAFDPEKYEIVYFDAAIADLGDIQYPSVNDDKSEVSFIPNALFKLSRARASGKPVVVMIDELGKAMKPVMNALLPLLLERRIGVHPLPEGSVVFATTNLATDGVGDTIPAHAHNRMTVVKTYGPTLDAYLQWGINNEMNHVVLAWVRENPHAVDCYASPETGRKGKDNPYNFNPLTGNTRAFSSHRSLTKASSIVDRRNLLGAGFHAALAGTIGKAAAADMQAYIDLDSKAATWEEILANPETVPVAEGVAGFMQALKCAAKFSFHKGVDKQVMKYVARWPQEEARMLMVTMLMKRGSDHILANLFSNPDLTALTQKYGLLASQG